MKQILFLCTFAMLALLNPFVSAGHQIETAYATAASTFDEDFRVQFQWLPETPDDTRLAEITCRQQGVQHWTSRLENSGDLQITDIHINHEFIFLTGVFTGDLWIDDLWLAARTTPGAFVAIFQLESGLSETTVLDDTLHMQTNLGFAYADGALHWQLICSNQLIRFNLEQASTVVGRKAGALWQVKREDTPGYSLLGDQDTSSTRILETEDPKDNPSAGG